MKDIVLRRANPQELELVLGLYEELFDRFDKSINYPKWTRGQYPNYDYLKKAQQDGALYLLAQGEEILAVAILDSDVIESYERVPWSENFPKEEVLGIHTFAVRDQRSGEGLGSLFMKKIIEYAKDAGYKAIHLDTIKGNSPAVHFYEKNGFTNLGKFELEYEDTDERCFTLFEYIL